MARIELQGERIGVGTTEHDLEKACASLGIPYVAGKAMQHRDDILNAASKQAACRVCDLSEEDSADCIEMHIGLEGTENQQDYVLRCCYCGKWTAYLRQQRIEKLMGASGLGERFKRRRFDTFQPSPETIAAYNACQNFCNKFHPHRQGIRMMGSYGCGKTHLAAAVLNQMISQGISGMFVVVPDLLAKIRQSFDTHDESAKQVIEAARNVGVLILDDLGAEKPSDWVREQLYLLINARYEAELPVIITTNCDTKELVSKLQQRIVSRIIETTDPVMIKAADYRLRKFA